MNCVILQPSYIPWRGYFHQIAKADVFIFLDDVQYDRRGWRNRNRIKTRQGSIWLTIPVQAKGSRQSCVTIDQIRIDNAQGWQRKHLDALRHSYRRAPYFEEYEPVLAEFYGREYELLADFTIDVTRYLARSLGITTTRFMRASTLAAEGAKTDRLLSLLQQVKATHYISGPSAKSYLEEDRFRSAGITLEYMEYSYPEYPQFYPPYDPAVSVLDLLFMCGPRASELIW
jgi:hypothetical protein